MGKGENEIGETMNDSKEEVKQFLAQNFSISEGVRDFVEVAEHELFERFDELENIKEYNQYKVLKAFQKNRISDSHFAWNTGYGLDDAGRDALEAVYSSVFNTEKTLVRPTIVSGTHAITIALMGILRPGDKLIYATGRPYDTLAGVIGHYGGGNDSTGINKGSLKDFGVDYDEVKMKDDTTIDVDALVSKLDEDTTMVAIQRATGYAFRQALSISEIKRAIDAVKAYNKDIIIMVDNCYGEFLDFNESTDVGADIIAGSLIKNPGGGLALCGGYITGKSKYVEMASYRMTSPAIGGECGLMFGQTRAMMQGLFMAPGIVNAAVKGAVLCAKVFENLGYEVCPGSNDKRNDIIEAIELGSREKVIAFCEGIQAAAPVDAFITPIPSPMPGYEDEIIMAAGAFVQGSSIELSADSPLREPYIAYFQGGLTYEHSRLGVMKALQTLCDKCDQKIKF